MQGREQVIDGNTIYKEAKKLLTTKIEERLQKIALFTQKQVDLYLDALQLMKTDVNDIRSTGYSLLTSTMKGHCSGYSINYHQYNFMHINERADRDRPRVFDVTLGAQGGYNCVVDGIVITPYLPTSSEISTVMLELQQQKRNLEKLTKPENDLEVKSVATQKVTLF